MGAMTRKQRILAAARCQGPDYVPVAPHTWQWLRKKYGNCSWMFEVSAALEYDFDPIPHLAWHEGPPFHNHVRILNGSYVHEGQAYCEDMAAGIRVHVDIERHEDHTLVSRRIETPAGPLRDAIRQPLPACEFGETIRRRPTWGDATHLEWLIKGPQDVEKVRFLLTMPTDGQLARIRKIQEAIGDNGLLQVDCFSPVDFLANEAMPLAELQAAAIKNMSFFDAVIDLFWDHTYERTQAYLRAGAEAIRGVWYNCGESAGWSVDTYREVFLPRLKKHVALAHEFGALYEYCEGRKVRNLLPMLKEAGIDVLSTVTPPPTGDVQLPEIKREVGGRICLRGFIDASSVIQNGTPASIDEAVRDAILAAAPGGGFIIGTTQQPITVHTDEQNLRAYFGACRQYGDYRHLGKSE